MLYRNVRFEDLSLKEKIGQLFMCGFDGLEPTAGIKGLIQEYAIGGVIYFRRNLAHAKQTMQLSNKLQQEARTPLFIAIDQEGGMVVRLEEGVTVMPGAMAQGAAANRELTREAAKWSGAELREIGINMNFAPCMDVNNNPNNPVIGVRSYGENPEFVGEMGVAAIAGYKDSGVAAVAKHFPGHGDTAVDSHYALPVVAHSIDRLNQVELVPFRQAIQNQVDAIMTAHVVFPAYEPLEVPATLSQRILTGLLRDQLGFEGVIVTDCLEMNAISETIGVARGAVEAIKAGADLILVSHRLDRQVAALEAVMEAVMIGEITEARIEEAALRIWKLKQARGLLLNALPNIDRDRAVAVANKLCEAAVTVIHGDPVIANSGKVVVIWTEARSGTEVIEVIPQQWTLGTALSAAGLDIVEVRIGIHTTEDERRASFAAVKHADTIVFASYDAMFSPKQSQLLRELAEIEHKRFLLVAMRTPYDGRGIEGLDSYICTYENKPMMVSALANVMLGTIAPQGRAPITVIDQ
ncbi:MAG: beta-N-acetylhexosaminidase [Candidatus Cohnella colombiensis]|uniref:Beta-N-acetylhexosaminidase n=1 Tax=Candidatus Cohnella colombiensis TaxID=3121368 RepID=A0AA95EUI2_9BACL|nr:MAG: beta-N-acetylhexosaminidase [Cohnella sp.]